MLLQDHSKLYHQGFRSLAMWRHFEHYLAQLVLRQGTNLNFKYSSRTAVCIGFCYCKCDESKFKLVFKNSLSGIRKHVADSPDLSSEISSMDARTGPIFWRSGSLQVGQDFRTNVISHQITYLVKTAFSSNNNQHNFNLRSTDSLRSFYVALHLIGFQWRGISNYDALGSLITLKGACLAPEIWRYAGDDHENDPQPSTLLGPGTVKAPFILASSI